jgi:hypothetical protein
MASIFISYRKSDAGAWAVALRDELVQAFGDNEVFLDADSLQAGRWSDQIEGALQACRVLIVVMGRGWVDASDAEGSRRIDNPDDVHRREIEQGLGRQGVTVLPVLVDGASMPAETDLPAPLRSLVLQQAQPWSTSADHRAADRARLLAAVRLHTGLRLRSPGAVSRWRSWWIALIGGAGSMAVLQTSFSLAGMPLAGSEFTVVFLLGAVASGLASAAHRRFSARRRSS